MDNMKKDLYDLLRAAEKMLIVSDDNTDQWKDLADQIDNVRNEYFRGN